MASDVCTWNRIGIVLELQSSMDDSVKSLANWQRLMLDASEGIVETFGEVFLATSCRVIALFAQLRLINWLELSHFDRVAQL